MKKLLKSFGLITMILGLLMGCSSGEEEPKKEALGQEQTKGEKEKQEEPDFSPSEKLAKEFVKVFYNESDREKAKSFIKKSTHKDVRDLFLLGVGGEVSEDTKLKEITIDGIVTTKSEGETGDVVKLHANNGEGKTVDVYVMLMDDKIGWVVREDKADGEEGKEMYNEFEKIYESKI